MPITCATLRLPAPSSDVVAMSLAIVFEITDILSPVDNVFVADNFAFFALLKKYFTFFLWIISITVPTRISKPIKITKDCIKNGGTVSASVKNGLVDIIVNLFLPLKIFSTLI